MHTTVLSFTSLIRLIEDFEDVLWLVEGCEISCVEILEFDDEQHFTENYYEFLNGCEESMIVRKNYTSVKTDPFRIPMNSEMILKS